MCSVSLPDSSGEEAIEHAAGSAFSWIVGLPAAELCSWQAIFDALAEDDHPCGGFCGRVLNNILTGAGDQATSLDILALAWIMKSGGWDTIL